MMMRHGKAEPEGVCGICGFEDYNGFIVTHEIFDSRLGHIYVCDRCWTRYFAPAPRKRIEYKPYPGPKLDAYCAGGVMV